MKLILKNFVKNYLLNLITIFFHIFRVFPIKNKKIVITNFRGKGFGDNPKYIANELLKRNMGFDIVWCVTKTSDFEMNNIRTVKIYSLKWFYEMATAKVWINNSRFPIFVRKRAKQYYIQTWHGGLGFKKIEQELGDKIDKYYLSVAKNDSKMIDVITANCKKIHNIFEKYFWYNGEILDIGFPRNDIFFKEDKLKETKRKIYGYYNITENKKIILYVPTFRDDKNYNYCSIDFNAITKELKEKKNEEYIFLIRLHPNVKQKINSSKNVIDATQYPDVYEILCASEMIISDYSSIIFDYLYMNKPIYLYAPDYEEYNKNRGMDCEYQKLPFIISYNQNELSKNIIEESYKNKLEELKKFIDDSDLYDKGKASEKICNLIIDKIIIKGDCKNEKQTNN